VENLDVIVLRHLRDWRSQGRRALLATVVRTWGSSPRPVGSIMGLCETGAVVGSVSGGCIEDDLIVRYTQASKAGISDALHDGPPQLLRYGITADEAHRFGLPCGGTLELLLEFNPSAAPLTALVQRLESGGLVQRVTDLASGEVHLESVSQIDELSIDSRTLKNTYGPEYRMLLIEPDRRCCVLALTHDPKLDDIALLEALQSDAFYVGAIGSRSNNAERHRRMIEHFGQTEESLARLRGPIGIYIGSKTPAEIAVSVMAEVLAVKNAVPLPRDLDVAFAKNSQMK